MIQRSLIYGHYEKVVDRESAYEKLKARAEAAEEAEEKQPRDAGSGSGRKKQAAERSGTGMLLSSMAKSAAHAIGSQIGRQIIRGVLGSLLGGHEKEVGRMRALAPPDQGGEAVPVPRGGRVRAAAS